MGEVVNLFKPERTPKEALLEDLMELHEHPDRWSGCMTILLDDREGRFHVSLNGARLRCSQALAMLEAAKMDILREMGYMR